jgi:hypothetical protein
MFAQSTHSIHSFDISVLMALLQCENGRGRSNQRTKQGFSGQSSAPMLDVQFDTWIGSVSQAECSVSETPPVLAGAIRFPTAGQRSDQRNFRRRHSRPRFEMCGVRCEAAASAAERRAWSRLCSGATALDPSPSDRWPGPHCGSSDIWCPRSGFETNSRSNQSVETFISNPLWRTSGNIASI